MEEFEKITIHSERMSDYLTKPRIMRVDGIPSKKKNAGFPQRITHRIQTKVGIRDKWTVSKERPQQEILEFMKL